MFQTDRLRSQQRRQQAHKHRARDGGDADDHSDDDNNNDEIVATRGTGRRKHSRLSQTVETVTPEKHQNALNEQRRLHQADFFYTYGGCCSEPGVFGPCKLPLVNIYRAKALQTWEDARYDIEVGISDYMPDIVVGYLWKPEMKDWRSEAEIIKPERLMLHTDLVVLVRKPLPAGWSRHIPANKQAQHQKLIQHLQQKSQARRSGKSASSVSASSSSSLSSSSAHLLQRDHALQQVSQTTAEAIKKATSEEDKMATILLQAQQDALVEQNFVCTATNLSSTRRGGNHPRLRSSSVHAADAPAEVVKQRQEQAAAQPARSNTASTVRRPTGIPRSMLKEVAAAAGTAQTNIPNSTNTSSSSSSSSSSELLCAGAMTTRDGRIVIMKEQTKKFSMALTASASVAPETEDDVDVDMVAE